MPTLTTDAIEILCPKCWVCGTQAVLKVDAMSFASWKRGELIQKAFPDMSKETREMLITGIHPKCWTEMFGEEE